MARTWVAVLCLAGLVEACSSKPTVPEPSGTVSPSGLTVLQDTPNSLVLRWTAPTAPFDSYIIEVSDVVHPYQQVGDPFPSSWTGLRLSTQNPFPEMIHLYFRLTAISGGKPLGPAATADFLEPLRDLGAAVTYGDGGIVVSWVTQSTVADRIEISRRSFRLPDGPGTSPPSVVSVPLTPSTWVDTALDEATSYQYVLTLRAGPNSGSPVTATTATPLLPPLNLALTPRGGGVDLRWTNQSTAATRITILRFAGLVGGAGGPIASLAPDAGSYRDVPPVPGLYTYSVETHRQGYESAGISNSGLAPPNGALRFDGNVLPVEQGIEAVRNKAGEWTVCGSDGVVDLSGHRPSFPPSGYFGPPCVMLDPSDQPHHLFEDFVDAGTALSVSQAWFDGSQWQTEEIVSGTGVGGPWLALDSRGEAHAVWQIYDENNQPVSFHYAHRTAAGWIQEPVAITPVGREFPMDMQVGGDGVVHVVTGPTLAHLERATDAGWRREALPVTWGATEQPAAVHLRTLQGSNLLLAFVWDDWTKAGDRLEVLTRVDGSWSGPEVVATRDLDTTYKEFRAAVDPTSGRTGLTFSIPDVAFTPGAPSLYVRTDGGWSTTAIGDDNTVVMGLAFDPDGGIHGLEYLGQFDATFDEVP